MIRVVFVDSRNQSKELGEVETTLEAAQLIREHGKRLFVAPSFPTEMSQEAWEKIRKTQKSYTFGSSPYGCSYRLEDTEQNG